MKVSIYKQISLKYDTLISHRYVSDVEQTEQEDLLSQSGRAMLRVCIASIH